MDIVSLAPSNTEILYEIGAGDSVVATTALCDRPEKAAKLPSVGGWTNPKISRIHEFSPDLVLASDDLQDEAVSRIEEEGFPVIQVKPHSLEEVYESILEVGEAVGHLVEAENLVDTMREEIEGLEVRGSPRVYFEEWMDPPMASGNWITGILKEIGAEPFLKSGERSREIKPSKIRKFDPEHILLNICGAGENLDPDPVIEREGWQDIAAVENENVSVVDDSLFNRPGPRLTEAAKVTKKMIEESNSD